MKKKTLGLVTAGLAFGLAAIPLSQAMAVTPLLQAPTFVAVSQDTDLVPISNSTVYVSKGLIGLGGSSSSAPAGSKVTVRTTSGTKLCTVGLTSSGGWLCDPTKPFVVGTTDIEAFVTFQGHKSPASEVLHVINLGGGDATTPVDPPVTDPDTGAILPPSGVVDPSKPTDPVSPITDPDTGAVVPPSGVVDPGNPTDPVSPITDPDTGAIVHPGVDPVKPTDPVVKPTDPVTPVAPSDPNTGAVKPSAPVKPIIDPETGTAGVAPSPRVVETNPLARWASVYIIGQNIPGSEFQATVNGKTVSVPESAYSDAYMFLRDLKPGKNVVTFVQVVNGAKSPARTLTINV